MNPRISRAWLESKELEDPIAFRREYLAEFEAAISAALDPVLVRGAVRAEGDTPAIPDGAAYVLATDPAATGDRWTLVGGWRGPDGRIVVDLARSWRGTRGTPVVMDATLDEIADIARTRRAPVSLDQWSSEALTQGLAKRQVRVLARPWSNESKSDALGHLRRHLYAGMLSIPAHPELAQELSNLEVRALPSGRSRIAAPGGGHDDWATACMALVAELANTGRGGAFVAGVHRDGPAGDPVGMMARTRELARRREAAAFRDPREG
jgi:hypothetical protein